jgi:hypothetical protein
MIVPQHLRDIRHTQGHAGMAGIRLQYGIHGEHANGVREFET